MSANPHHKEVLVRKASGKTEAFEIEKLKTSLRNAGASEDAIDEVVSDILSWIFDGVTTAKIYARAFRIYKQISSSGALLYKLKKAILEMGPSGYPFEHLVGELFRRKGYEVEVGQTMQGMTISHEMDVIAKKGNTMILGECKFSHKQGNSVGIQVPLYVHSRVNDIVEKLKQQKENQSVSFSAQIFTNGRFSSDSIEYSKQKGIQLMGWDFPGGSALKDLIEKEKIFPITILTKLNKAEKKALMEDGIVTCDQLFRQASILERMGMSARKKNLVVKELKALSGA